jgi:hypothetical protein
VARYHGQSVRGTRRVNPRVPVGPHGGRPGDPRHALRRIGRTGSPRQAVESGRLERAPGRPQVRCRRTRRRPDPPDEAGRPTSGLARNRWVGDSRNGFSSSQPPVPLDAKCEKPTCDNLRAGTSGRTEDCAHASTSQVISQHASCVERGGCWLHYGRTDAPLPELAAARPRLAPRVMESILSLAAHGLKEAGQMT